MHVSHTVRASIRFNAGPKPLSPKALCVVWPACYMTDSRVLPFTIKSRVAALCLLITLLSLLVGAAVPEDRRTSGSSLQIDQLASAFKLLQLQLKQTTETAEHVQAILASLAQPQGDAASDHELAGDAVISTQHEQTEPRTHADVHQGTSVLST